MTMREAIRWDLDPSFLHFQFTTWTFEEQRRGVVARVIGEYRQGSAGRDDAVVMKQRISEACELAGAEALVVDLRSLDYQWGDDIDVDPRNHALRAVSLIRPEQFEAFAPMLGRDWLRMDVDVALDDAEKLAKPESGRDSHEKSERTFTRLNLDISELERLCRVWSNEGSGRMVWLSFHGDCTSDSDAMWIQWQIDAANAIVEPRGILIDVCELESITHEFPVAPRGRNRAVLVVARPEQLDVLHPFLADDAVRTDLEIAALEIEQLVRAAK